MSERYTARFEVRGGERLFYRVCDAALDWVWSRFAVAREADHGEDGDWEADGQRLRIRRGSAAGLGFFIFAWTVPDTQRPEDRWTVELRLSTEGEGVAAEVRLSLEAEDELVHTDVGAASRPPRGYVRVGLIRELLDAFDCRAGSLRLTGAPRHVSAAGAAQFVRELLLNPDRTLPVVAVSPDRGGLAWDADDLQGRLAARAIVAVLADDATRAISDELGTRLACYGGAVRVYQPGLANTDNPWRHRFWLAHAVRGAGRAFLDELLAQLGPAAAGRAIGGFDDVRARVLSVTRERSGPSQAESDAVALLEQLVEAEQERDEAKRKSAQFEQLFEVQVQRTIELTAELDREQAGGHEPRSVSEAVQLAEERLPYMRFLSSAVKSSQQSQFPRPDEIYQAFSAVHSLARDLRRGLAVERAGDRLRERGVDYVARESHPTMRKHGASRQFRDGERVIEMQSHIRLGGGSGGANTLRIHLSWDREEGRWLIGHIGRHLRTSSG